MDKTRRLRLAKERKVRNIEIGKGFSMDLKKIGLAALVIVVLLVAGIVATGNRNDGEGEMILAEALFSEIGSDEIKAPDFNLERVDGEVVSLSDYKGKVILLNFWATWCMPCRQEIPSLIKLQEKYQGDIVVLGISMDANGPEVVPDFVHQFDINYPVLYGDGRVANRFGGVTGIPTTFVIDRNFLVKRRYIGFRPHYVFENDIKELL